MNNRKQQSLIDYKRGQVLALYILDRGNKPNNMKGKYFYNWNIKINNNKYELYSFDSLEFVNGFIDTFNEFSKDFRYYIEYLPFSYYGNRKTYYKIQYHDVPLEEPKKYNESIPYYNDYIEDSAIDYE